MHRDRSGREVQAAPIVDQGKSIQASEFSSSITAGGDLNDGNGNSLNSECPSSAHNMLDLFPDRSVAISTQSQGKSWVDVIKNTNNKVSDKLFYINPLDGDDEEVVDIPNEEIEEAAKEWVNTIVAYVVGNRPYYFHFAAYARRTWKLDGDVKIYSRENGFFYIKFDLESDFRRVLDEGPWSYQGRPIYLFINDYRKLIGARYYIKGYEAYYGPLNLTYSYLSPRDSDGHGTHTASTVAGRSVRSVSSLGGFAHGTAAGGASLAHLAVYKVCWPIPGPNPNLENTCFDADMLAAFDDAVGDGVDVISMSIGSSGVPPRYVNDSMAIGALHAAKRDIVVACSGGNAGPGAATVVNLAPWMITVGASSIDRAFDSEVVLGSGKMIEGQTVTPDTLKRKMYPLVYAGNVEVPGTLSNVSGQCLPNSLSAQKAHKKVVLCFRGAGSRVAKGLEVKRVGGAAIILGNGIANGNEIPVDAHVLPGTGVSSDDAISIMKYINSTIKPTVTICKATTSLDVRPAPVMAAFSSRGPNRVEPDILKPDVTAPGLNILAAWSESSGPTKLDGDRRRVKYNLMSGTSMACPHVSAVAALIKSLHPDWSAAAIKSAIMTTATSTNLQGGPITTAAKEVAGSMDFGSGHIRPAHAADPGLVYDATYNDYLLFACSSINAQMDPLFACPVNPPPPYNLNYPSVTVSKLNGTVNVTRSVTNVGRKKALYEVTVSEPNGVNVKISPERLSFRKAGERKSFVITLSSAGKGNGEYVAGSYTWNDGIHVVRSPIVISVV